MIGTYRLVDDAQGIPGCSSIGSNGRVLNYKAKYEYSKWVKQIKTLHIFYEFGDLI